MDDLMTMTQVYLMRLEDSLYEITRDRSEHGGFIIDTDMPAECETFLKNWLMEMRVPGRPVYRLTDDQAARAADAVVQWEQEDMPSETAVRLLEKLPTTGELLAPTKAFEDQRKRIWSIETMLFRLSVELERRKNQLKLTIGDADGIDLMATWMSEDSGTRELRFL